DTVQTLEAIGGDAVVMRHWASGAAHQLANFGWASSAIINAGDGTHEHPTQALLDAFTLRRRLHNLTATGKNLEGKHVVMVGDILHSRVGRSNGWLLHTLGAKVTLSGPPTLMPVGVKSWPVDINYDLDALLAQRPDAVMMLRVQAERMSGDFFPSASQHIVDCGLTTERYKTIAGTQTLIMHPGPMNRGLEISAAAADSVQNTALEQVANGVSVRMAVLYLLLASQPGQ